MTGSSPSSTFWQSFGPGLLWAAAAIGVSHLVQSTRAGADAGFGLAWVVLVALVLKYPFFEYGPRYAAATGSSLVEGYRGIGGWALWLYLGITIATSLIAQATVVLFTAFLIRFAFGLSWSIPVVTAVLLAACTALLVVGRFRLLDLTIKVILAGLAISTMWAAAVTAPRSDPSTFALWDGGALVRFGFLLALVGWMPSPVDTGVWSSLWTLAKDEATGTRASVRNARADFLVSYIGTGVLAFAFLVLGAGVMYGSGETLSSQGPVFATQLVDLYGTTLGTWARPVVMVAVVTTMLSTSVTVVDGFPRAIDRSITCIRLGRGNPAAARSPGSVGPTYWWALALLAVLTVVIHALFVGSLTGLVDFATTISFLTAPLLGWLNLRCVTAPEVPPDHRPSQAMLVLSWVGLVLLGGTGVAYLGWLVLN